MALRIMDRLRAAAAGFKAASVPGYIWTPGRAQWSEWDFERYAKEAYRGNPYGYAAMRMVLTAAAGIRLQVSTRKGEDLEEVPSAHPLRRLLDRPNELMGWPEFVEAFLGGLLVGGHGAGLANGPQELKPGDKVNASRPPTELWPLRPDSIAPVFGEKLGDLQRFDYRPKGAVIHLHRSSVLFVKSWDPISDTQGVPPAAPAGKSFDTNADAMAYNKSVLQNGGVPGTVLVAPENAKRPVFANSKEEEQYKAQFDLRHGGPTNAGRLAVLFGGLTPHKIGTTPQEMSWKDAIEQTAIQIGLVYGVAPELLGIASQKTYANVKEARAALYQETVIPLLDRFCGALGRFWAPWDPSVVVNYDPDDVEALQEEQDKKWTRISAADDLTVNEKRAARGYDPVPGGDVILVPSGKVPLEVATGAPITSEPVP